MRSPDRHTIVKPKAKAQPTESWWIGKSRTDLNAEARKRFPEATTGQVFTGVVFELAKRNGLLSA